MMILCFVCVCVGWVFGEWLWGGKKDIWDLGLVILKTISWSVVKHGFCGGSGLTFGGFVSEESTKRFKWDRYSNKV